MATSSVGRVRPHWLLLGGAVVLAVPLVIALGVLREPRWYPAMELAQTELHVRDVGTARTPLTGLVGRLGDAGERGSHPGPASFIALAPVYRLAGASPWALQVATVALHVGAVGTALWIAQRRGGRRLCLMTGALLAVLLRFYGPTLLTEPWNPYLPMLWWVVFLLAMWSVVEDDLALLPVVVASGSLCAQTHVSYAGLVGGLAGCATATVLARAVRDRRRGTSSRRTWSWLAVTAAVGALLWLPPVIDELKEGRGNLSLLVDYFRDAPEANLGLRRALELLLANLDPWRLLFGHADAKVVLQSGWSIGGLVFVAAWLGAVVVAWRIREAAVLRLHALVAITLVLGVVSTSRIFGPSWAWLLQWSWGFMVVASIAIGWTAALGLTDRLAPARRPGIRRAAVAGLAVVALGSVVAAAGDARDVEPDDVASGTVLRQFVPATLEAIDADGGPYLVTWADPIGVVGDLQAFGLVNELDRAGISVGLVPEQRLRAAPYLTLDPARAAAVVRVVTGPAIEVWDARPDARRLSLYDPRTYEERAQQASLRAEIDAELVALGLPELIAQVDTSFVGAIFTFSSDPRVPDALVRKMERTLALGIPSAVYLTTSL